MKLIRPRPFYTDYAWAFDLIIDRPVRKECAAIVEWLVERGVVPGARLLDAGCGTGRYARELSRRGYVVHGIDRVRELIDVAAAGLDDDDRAVSFAVDDIFTVPPQPHDAVLCRGVLNDIIDDHEREMVFEACGANLRDGGVLVLDVREWTATAERKAREPLFRKRVATNRGELTFTSVTDLEPESHALVISESHTLMTADSERTADYQFIMRCWTRGELASALEGHGFGRLAWFGAYDRDIPADATDRLVVVAQRGAGT